MSGFIIVNEAPVSKNAATLIGLAYLVGMTYILITGERCIVWMLEILKHSSDSLSPSMAQIVSRPNSSSTESSNSISLSEKERPISSWI